MKAACSRPLSPWRGRVYADEARIGQGRCRLWLSILPAACLLLGQACVAATLSGTVTDRTTGKVSPGDTVALIAFAQGMQVASETRTDARGQYTLQLPDGDTGQHLVRVSHEKAAYFQPVPPGAHDVNVDVYDVATAVKGISTEADVLSMQTGPGGELQITEDFFVRNSSEPAMTQLSDHAYEFYLQEGVHLEGTAAMGPGGMPVQSAPVPLPGKGHYAFVFPVRPGETRFQVSYTLPYAGKTLAWTQREGLLTENLVVLMPKSMRFSPTGTDWQPVPANPDAQTFVRKGVAPGEAVAFTVNGQGQLPRETQPNGGNGAPTGAGSATATTATSGSMAADTRPGGGLGPPVDTPDPIHRYKPWLLGGLGVLLLAGAVVLLRTRPADGNDRQETMGPAGAAGAEPRYAASGALRPALEQALLALEREHARSLISAADYEESRLALQKLLHRALAREAPEEAKLAPAAAADVPTDLSTEPRLR